MAAFDPVQLQACFAASWSPHLGDPTLLGWLTVAAYVLAALACVGAAVTRHRDRVFWAVLAVGLAALCINKQLDLHQALTVAGRCVAKMQGWFEHRRVVQLVFVLILLVVGAAVLGLALIRMRRRFHRLGLALCGTALLVVYVAMRAIGFHHVDETLVRHSLGGRPVWILEVTGIAMILLNAMAAIRGRGRRRGPAEGALPGESRVRH